MPRITHNYKAIIQPDEFPEPAYETVDCPQCNYRILVDPDYYDWKKDADLYRKMYREMHEFFADEFAEAGRVYNLPLAEWFEGRKLVIIAQLEALVKRLREEPEDDEHA